MVYAVANIHGCYDKYKEILKEINFSNEDTLFVLGDTLDGGDKGIEILFDMMLHANIFPILGEHDLIAYEVLSGVEKETRRDMAAPLSKELSEKCQRWMESGGEGTLSGFAKLSDDDKVTVLEYLEEFSLYEEIEAGGKQYVLCHNMPSYFEEGGDLDDYSAEDVLDGEIDYQRDYFPGKTLITAHKTTIEIDKGSKGRIYKKGSNIAIDCGALYGGYLAAYCLDTGEEFYA